jgi:hypothetical protein
MAPEFAPDEKLQAGIRWDSGTKLGLKCQQNKVKRYKGGRAGMAGSEFQDRCLKLLGHPSVTQPYYALSNGRCGSPLQAGGSLGYSVHGRGAANVAVEPSIYHPT